MKASKLMLLSASALALSAVMLGIAFSAAPRVSVAQQSYPCSYTPISVDNFTSLGQTAFATDTPIPTCTPVRLKTHTPTKTPTEAATQTPVPSTPVPTQPAATATPAGGSEGQGVRPPDTGSGPGASGSVDVSLLVAGIALAALGGSSMLVLAVKRR